MCVVVFIVVFGSVCFCFVLFWGGEYWGGMDVNNFANQVKTQRGKLSLLTPKRAGKKQYS